MSALIDKVNNVKVVEGVSYATVNRVMGVLRAIPQVCKRMVIAV
jgi:hypothetical protein